MKLLILNPNSDKTMANKIQTCARYFAGERFQVDCLCAPGGPEFLETYLDIQRSAPGMMQLLQENLEKYDGFLVACGYDPNLDLLKELTCKPVVGTAEASMKIATMVGHRFSILCTDAHSIPIKEELALHYGVDRQVASVRVAQLPHCSGGGNKIPSELADAYVDVCRRAVEEDGAEVVVLSCAGFSRLDQMLTQRVGIPVLDGITCGLILLEGMIRSGISISKVRRFRGG